MRSGPQAGRSVEAPAEETARRLRDSPTSVVAGIETTDAIRDGARLTALRELELLDNGPNETIDRFTRLATEMLGVPVSLVSLLDDDRQYFISQQGLGAEWAEARQTPLSHSFCQYAVATKEPLVVEDSRRDPLLRESLAVRDLGVVAYAGMPLVLADGNAVGALCAIDDKPHLWSKHELRVLEDLAAGVKALLDLRAALAERGLHDRLTGLPNRDLLVAYCDQLLDRNSGDTLVAVMCAGLDHFAQINQAFGTDNADAVLRAVAEQMRTSVRDSDVFGRLRGDVFVLVAPGVRDEAEALGLAGRLRDGLLSQPVTVGEQELSVGVTVGIATGQRAGSGSDLISEAANAMHEAKKHPGRVRVSDAAWSEQAATQLRLRDSLRAALANGEISAVYQPIVELEGARLRGFETLARWHSPRLGDVSPADFVPVAEMTGDIIPIGEWMLREATRQLADWRARFDPGLQITVNVSPLQLEQPNFAEIFASILEGADLPGDAIGIEITEGGLLETGVIPQRNLSRLKDLGANIVLDDFGTGYSALSYLRKFPIDVIKIDRSFVGSIGEDLTAAALVEAIVAMSRALNLEVIAEGIETKHQASFLRRIGCRHGQGYLFGRPAAAEALTL